MSTRTLASFAALVALASGCTNDDYTRLYYTEPYAPSLDPADIEALEHMGPMIVDQGVNFAVYSERAERIDLLLFDDPEAELPTQQFTMTRCGDVWSAYVEGIGVGQHYGFVAWGPNWPYTSDFFPGSDEGFIKDVDEYGNRFNPNKLLTDPWGKAVHRDHDWSKGSLGTGESRRDESTWAAASKSIVLDLEDDTYTWSASEDEWLAARKAGTHHAWNELIYYEVHPKGFTANGVEGVEHPGTFRGVGEYAAYLSDLGVTAVEFLPIHEKPLDGGYWGYNNLSFFSPEVSYAAATTVYDEPLEVIDEFKWMVDQLHQQGVEVIVDVVYNHTGEGGLWRDKIYQTDWSADGEAVESAVNLDSIEVAGLYSYRGFDNPSWYGLTEDNLEYWNNTGVGNQTRPNYTPTRRLIIDSLRFMVEELHVDGFRFDLAGILGEEDLNFNTWDDPANTVLQDIIDDPVLQENNVRIIAEPWTAAGYSNLSDWTPIGDFPMSTEQEGYGWGEWNARFRDWWRAFMNYDGTGGYDWWGLNSAEGGLDGGAVITGSYDLYAWNGRKPYHTTNFITVHDGFTMFDLLSYDSKQNGCSPINPDCCDQGGYSVWCDADSGEDHNRSRTWGDDSFKRQLMRNFFVSMMISHGTPLILGGDEWMRTQYGNNNAYANQADNEWNWFRWGEWMAYDDRHRMHDFVSQITRFRLDHTYALAPLEWGEGMPFSWKSEYNSDDIDWGGRTLMIHYYNPSGDPGEYGPELAILINMDPYSTKTFTLPGDRTWARLVDTQMWFDIGDEPGTEGWLAENPDHDPQDSANISLDAPEVIPDASYGVPPYSIVILEQQVE
jgi:isoamylase